MTPDLVDGAKVKAREFQARLAWDILRTTELSCPQNVSPAPRQCRRLTLGLGTSVWRPCSLNIPLTGLKDAWKMSSSGVVFLDSSLPLFLGTRRRVAFCRHLRRGQASEIRVKRPVRSWSSRGDLW